MTAHSVYFDLSDVTVRVVVPDAETIKSLRAFFDPYVLTVPEANNFYEITTVIDPGLYGATKTDLPSTPDAEITTTLQHDVEYKLKCFHSQACMVIEDEPLQVFYVVDGQNRRTQIIATEGSRVRTSLLRIIRGAWVLGQDGLIVHGCGLEKNGSGIVISGEKYAGKTTSLLSLCVNRGYDIVANDRLLLSQSGIARGIPTVVKLRPRTLKPFTALRHLIDVPLFGVSDLARALRVTVKKEVALKAIAFLSYDESVRKPVFRRLSLDEARQVLSSHLFTRREYEWVSLMRIGDTVRDATEKNVLSGVSCFKLSCNETHIDEVAGLLDGWCQSREPHDS
jgi:hypothetical protein